MSNQNELTINVYDARFRDSLETTTIPAGAAVSSLLVRCETIRLNSETPGSSGGEHWWITPYEINIGGGWVHLPQGDNRAIKIASTLKALIALGLAECRTNPANNLDFQYEDQYRCTPAGLALAREFRWTTDAEWAQEQFDAIQPTGGAIREFDASEDGKRYLAITGMTMWANLGGDTLE